MSMNKHYILRDADLSASLICSTICCMNAFLLLSLASSAPRLFFHSWGINRLGTSANVLLSQQESGITAWSRQDIDHLHLVLCKGDRPGKAQCDDIKETRD